jgi:hypothetical protein
MHYVILPTLLVFQRLCNCGGYRLNDIPDHPTSLKVMKITDVQNTIGFIIWSRSAHSSEGIQGYGIAISKGVRCPMCI